MENKQDSIVVSGKSKKCHSCKKKNVEINELPQINEEMFIEIPSGDELLNSYLLLGNKELSISDKEKISNDYKFIFNEDFHFDCNSCINQQTIKFRNFLKYHLKLNV